MNIRIYRIIILSMLSIGLLISSALAGRQIDKIEFPPLNDFIMPEVQVDQLSNGIKIYLLEDHDLPVVNASVRLAAGGYLVSNDKIGLAEILGSVMRTGGTARMTGDEIDETLEKLGAHVETYMSNTSGGASMNILSDHVDTGLEILADILRTPQFAEDKIDIEKAAQRIAISSRNDEPLGICVREYRKILYGAESPYVRQTEYETIEKITRDDLLAFQAKFISPENIMIAVYGDINMAEMKQKLEKYFGDWVPSGFTAPPLPKVKDDYSKGIHYIEKDNVTQSTIFLGHLGGLTGDPDYFALTVANNVLGGGLGGRIFNEVRSKKGLAYSTGASFTSNIAYPGIFYGYVITKLETTVAAAEAVWTEMRRMQTDPPTEDELRKAKDSYLNSFVFNFDSKRQIINRMMSYDFHGFPSDFLQTAKTKIEQITAEDVIDVCKRRYHPDEMHLVVVGKADEFDKPLSSLGEVNNIDISIPEYIPEEIVVVNEETLAKGMAIYNKSVKACGGAKKFAAIKSGQTKTTYTLITPQMNIELNGETFFEFPYNSREMFSHAMMGEIISVTTETEGWVKQMGQLQQIGADDLAESKKELFRNHLHLFAKASNPDFKAVYVKSEEINGAMADIVKFISNDNEDLTFKIAFDSETSMPLAKMYFGKTMMGPASLVQYLSDFTEINGIMIPLTTDVKTDKGDGVAIITHSEYAINPTLPADTFAKPE